MLDLHYWPTPNGKKVTIQLEECGLEYNVAPCNIGRGDQFKESFLGISPNNRMPALVDHAPDDGGAPLPVFESGAIMLYIAEKTGQFMPSDARGKYNVMQWVIWQMANQGPKTGECGHFRRLGDSSGDQSYAVNRFTNEVNRFYGVLNNQLYRQRYICGEEYTIADMIIYPWTVGWSGQGQDIDEFKYFKRWFNEIGDRDAVQRGMAVGKDFQNDTSKLSNEEKATLRDMLYNQRARPAPESGGLEI
ncbi:MAG: glutathione S-transferase N-terminal domain-containing protein [Gammaproteobacteria bacterium]|nr:glutathione S-transferase N-terminal domain-containing protein [Gammaproteobacteria bacterium]